MENRKAALIQIIAVNTLSVLLSVFGMGCASFKSALGFGDSDRVRPISNPFYSYRPNPKGGTGETMILRTKKGDRSVELEIPAGSQQLSDFVLPVSPAFRENGRSPASEGSNGEDQSLDGSYKSHPPTPSDHEITRSFSQGSIESEGKRHEIEQSLNLAPTQDDTPIEGSSSYLANMDHVKQLYKSTRYEAALLEIDDMIKQYQTDSKLYEMRGTLLDRLGRKELAVKSWAQALKLDPKNESLRRFV